MSTPITIKIATFPLLADAPVVVDGILGANDVFPVVTNIATAKKTRQLTVPQLKASFDVEYSPIISKKFNTFQTFMASGSYTWTVPNGVTLVRAKLQGGGGGGGIGVGGAGNTGSTTAYGPGGGGGSYAEVLFPVTPGETLSVAVGHGGVPSSNTFTLASAGADTSITGIFGTIIAAGGGGFNTTTTGGLGASLPDVTDFVGFSKPGTNGQPGGYGDDHPYTGMAGGNGDGGSPGFSGPVCKLEVSGIDVYAPYGSGGHGHIYLASDASNRIYSSYGAPGYTTIEYPNYVVISEVASPAGSGTLTGGGEITLGSSTFVHAVATGSYTFVNWTENGAVVSTSSTYSFTASNDRFLVANFM